MIYIWSLIVVSFASLLKGITGFGFGIIALPILMNWYTPKELIPVITLCNLVSSLVIVFQKKEEKLINKQFASLIISGGLFTVIGVIALNYISDNLLTKIMSVIFIVLSLVSLRNRSMFTKLSGFTYVTAGAVVGFLSGCISASGPSLAIFLNNIKISKLEFREIFAWFSVVTAIIATIGYWQIGLITEQTLKMTMLFSPLLIIGSVLGKKLNSTIPSLILKKATIILTLIASVTLLIR